VQRVPRLVGLRVIGPARQPKCRPVTTRSSEADGVNDVWCIDVVFDVKSFVSACLWLGIWNGLAVLKMKICMSREFRFNWPTCEIKEVKMIPQAIASTGAYADLWSYLKSMTHALERAQKARNLTDIAELDKARLLALAEFLKKELENKDATDMFSPEAFLACKSDDYSYTLDTDLRTLLQELPSFKAWLKSQKSSFKDKSLKLAVALEDYVATLNESLFPENPPKEEFIILHDLLAELLLQTESALVT
jgi:hypothetical protein